MATYFSHKSSLTLALLSALIAVPFSASAQSIYIGDESLLQVVRYDIQTGAFQGVYTSGHDFSFPQSLAFAPDGTLYAGDADFYEITQFDNTGAYQRTVSHFDGGLGLLVGPGGILYEVDSYAVISPVPEPFRGHLLGIDPQTGNWVSDYRGVIGGSFYDVKLGPDHNFYVVDNEMRQVYSFDGATGALRGAFTSGGDLQDPFGVAFGPDGNLYVTSRGNHKVVRFNGLTGVFMDVFASGSGLDFPNGALFGPDGNLYVADFGSNQISRFNGSTGAYDVFVSGVVGPMAFAPVQAPCPGDLNGDRAVSLSDLTILLAHFGTLSGAALADGDLDADGDVDLSDLTILLLNFGTTCS